MKNSIVLPLLSVTLLLSLLTPSLGQQPKLCPVTFPLPVKGACGSDGDFRCIDEALKRFAASQVPQKCSCSDARPASSQCQCSIICTNPAN
ncbi:putative defensin-like protein 244 [Coffea eugenioides]|uniref:putative defensin-like protein 244 n=1 Tax=Coffea eugenioides TaxID=49369 RepID=UPI000F6137FC|nr:putative defensin-like protein 244 [Coffea eugenioides]